MALLALLFLAAPGCKAPLAPIRGPEVIHNHQPQDLPVPVNFKLSDDPYETWANVSFAGEPLYLRTGKYTYYGDRPLPQVATWYKDQMPIEGWEYIDRSSQNDEIKLRFEKPRESAEISLKLIPDKQGQFYITKLVARIRPR